MNHQLVSVSLLYLSQIQLNESKCSHPEKSTITCDGTHNAHTRRTNVYHSSGFVYILNEITPRGLSLQDDVGDVDISNNDGPDGGVQERACVSNSLDVIMSDFDPGQLLLLGMKIRVLG
jgi:hypothetical protein